MKTLPEIVTAIGNAHGIPKQDVKAVIADYQTELRDTLLSGDNATIHGIGTIALRAMSPDRKYKLNGRTHTPKYLSRLGFRASDSMLAELNK